MAALEFLDPTTLDAFLAAPVAVLVLAKTDCDACAQWTQELQDWLAAQATDGDPDARGIRFGKLILNQPRLGGFKKAHPWLAEVDVLPTNVIFRDGQVDRRWAGGGIERLVNRLRRGAAAG